MIVIQDECDSVVLLHIGYAPDKKLIKKALDDGFDVPGARIVKKDRLEIK